MVMAVRTRPSTAATSCCVSTSARPKLPAAASAKALELVAADPTYRTGLQRNSARLRQGLRALGIELIEGLDAGQVKLNPDIYVVGNTVSRGKFPLMEEILDRGLPRHGRVRDALGSAPPQQ